MEPSKISQTRCKRQHNTFTPSLHLVPFCQLLHPKKTFCMHLAYSHPLNEHGTQHCSLHSFPHERQSISAMFSSNKISQHNLKLPAYDTDSVLLRVSACRTEPYLTITITCPVATTLQPMTFCSLSENEITDDYMHELAGALEVNQSLQKLEWVKPFMLLRCTLRL